MAELRPREPVIIELRERQLNESVHIKCQYAPVAGIGRLALNTAYDRSQSGIYTYNMRTRAGQLAGLAAFAERSQNVLRTALLHELRTAGYSLSHPTGYPEVEDAANIALVRPAIEPDALEAEKYYLYAGTDCYSVRDFRVFQFDGLAEGHDSSAVPFTNVLYRPDGLRPGLHLLRFDAESAQPYRFSVHSPQVAGSVHERCAVPIYGDNSLPHLTPSHFTTMSTEQTFHPMDSFEALTVANLVPPIDWPPL
jgi:hypothetical protein